MLRRLKTNKHSFVPQFEVKKNLNEIFGKKNDQKDSTD